MGDSVREIKDNGERQREIRKSQREIKKVGDKLWKQKKNCEG